MQLKNIFKKCEWQKAKKKKCTFQCIFKCLQRVETWGCWQRPFCQLVSKTSPTSILPHQVVLWERKKQMIFILLLKIVEMGWLRFCTGAQSKLVPNGWKLRAILLRWLLPTSCTILFIFHEDTTHHQKEEPNQGFGQFLLFIYYSAQKSEQWAYLWCGHKLDQNCIFGEKIQIYEVKYRSNQSLVGNLNFLSQILLKLPSSWYVQVKICLHQKNFSDSASLFWILIKCLHFHIFSICSTSFRLKEPRNDLWLEWSILLIITQKRRSSILQCSLSRIEYF